MIPAQKRGRTTYLRTYLALLLKVRVRFHSYTIPQIVGLKPPLSPNPYLNPFQEPYF